LKGLRPFKSLIEADLKGGVLFWENI
jgi:hypothetical protein